MLYPSSNGWKEKYQVNVGNFCIKSSTISEDAVYAYYRKKKTRNYVLRVATTAPARASAMLFIRSAELKKTPA